MVLILLVRWTTLQVFKKSIIKYVPWSQARSRWHASKSPALANIDSQSSTCEVCERQDYSLICCSIMSQNKDLRLAFLLLDFFITIISVAHSTSSQKYLRISTPNYIQNDIYHRKIAFPDSTAPDSENALPCAEEIIIPNTYPRYSHLSQRVCMCQYEEQKRRTVHLQNETLLGMRLQLVGHAGHSHLVVTPQKRKRSDANIE